MLRKLAYSLMAAAFVFMTGCSSTTPVETDNPAKPAPTDSSAKPVDSTAGKKGTGFPEHQVELLVPYGAGSSVDLNARAISPSLEKALGVPVVVNNKEGGGGAVGFTYTASAKPDGYSAGIANIASICSVSVLGGMGVDPSKDYHFLGTTVTDRFLMATRADSPYNSIKDVVEYLKAHPKEISYGGSGAASMDAMLYYNLEAAAGVDMNMVSFQGGNQVVASLLGGHIDIYGGSLSEILPLIKDGKVKALAIGGSERAPQLPDTPTFEELGYKMTFNMAKRAIYVPADTDPAVIAVLEDAVKKAVEDPEFIKKAESMGLTPTYLSPEDSQKEVEAVMAFLKENKDKIVTK